MQNPTFLVLIELSNYLTPLYRYTPPTIIKATAYRYSFMKTNINAPTKKQIAIAILSFLFIV